MRAMFDKAVRYEVNAICLSPLRSGAGEEEDVLREDNGRMFIQGSSIAGALREWLNDAQGDKITSAIFGSPKSMGSLSVSDGIFSKDAKMNTRPRIRINGSAGSVDAGGKFDTAYVCPESKLELVLTWKGKKSEESQLSVIEQMLSALNSGEILLGGQKSNGFGRVGLEVYKRSYDMYCEKDRSDWMNNVFEGLRISLPAIKEKQLITFEVHAHTDELLVKSKAVVQQKGEEKGSCIPHLSENAKAVIPGSSIKGAVLSRVRAIAELLGIPDETVNEAFGRGAEGDDNGIAGKFRFEDAYYKNEEKKKITRIRIDLVTGGVIRGGIFKEEPVGGNLVLRISGEKNQDAACVLLLYALRDLGLGLYTLGGGSATGRGYLSVSKICAREDDKELTLSFDSEHRCSLNDKGLAEKWMKAIGGLSNE